MDKKVLEDQTQAEELLTEVTSVKREEEKTGKEIPVPTEEELIQRAHASFITSTQLMLPIFEKLKSRAKTRVLASILDLPKDGIPVKLKSNEEKSCFALGQRAISDRFLLTYYHIVDEQRARLKKLEETKTEETKETDNV